MRRLSRPALHRDAARDAELDGACGADLPGGIAWRHAVAPQGGQGLILRTGAAGARATSQIRHGFVNGPVAAKPLPLAKITREQAGEIVRWRSSAGSYRAFAALRPPAISASPPRHCSQQRIPAWPGRVAPGQHRQAAQNTHEPRRAAAFGAAESSLALPDPDSHRNHRGAP